MTHARHFPVTELTPAEVRSLLADRQILLVDVREPAEYAAERIHGAVLYPLSTLDPAMLPADEAHRIVFQCGSGKRSMMAAERYAASGARRVTHMAGGIGAWKGAGFPVVRVDPATGALLDPGRS